MKKLDLHGKSYEESEELVSIFIENNIDDLPIQIITGNSVEMKKPHKRGFRVTGYTTRVSLSSCS